MLYLIGSDVVQCLRVSLLLRSVLKQTLSNNSHLRCVMDGAATAATTRRAHFQSVTQLAVKKNLTKGLLHAAEDSDPCQSYYQQDFNTGRVSILEQGPMDEKVKVELLPDTPPYLSTPPFSGIPTTTFTRSTVNLISQRSDTLSYLPGGFQKVNCASNEALMEVEESKFDTWPCGYTILTRAMKDCSMFEVLLVFFGPYGTPTKGIILYEGVKGELHDPNIPTCVSYYLPLRHLVCNKKVC